MRLVDLTISNFYAISDEPISIRLQPFNVIIGRNDVGKSTVLRALDAFLNNSSVSKDSANMRTDSDTISIEVRFDASDVSVVIDDTAETTFVDEEICDEDGYLRVKKTWDVGMKTPKMTTAVYRKVYDKEDFLLDAETALMKKCKERGIETQKASSTEYQNVEKAKQIARQVPSGGSLFFVSVFGDAYYWHKSG